MHRGLGRVHPRAPYMSRGREEEQEQEQGQASSVIEK
jgi:hypothetical protein